METLQTPIGLRASNAARLRPTDDDLQRWAGDLAVTNLQRLSALQGTQNRPDHGEQPGKIVYEYWPTLPAQHGAEAPVAYPEAWAVQAWSAAAVLLFAAQTIARLGQ